MTRTPHGTPPASPDGDPSLPPPATDYLYDPRAPVDPEVARLERALGTLRHAPREASPTPIPHRREPARLDRRWLGAAAAALLLGIGAVGLLGRERPQGGGGVASEASAPLLHATGETRPLPERAWVETQAEPRELRLGDVGQFTLGAASRLEVRRLSADETRFYLERGRLEAFVSADAQPRFFQVDTPATRCVDLGCEYTLEVDAAGAAEVEVKTGRVAFENDGREVFVPRGARCRATRVGGAGTPRFADARAELVEALDRFDAARAASAAERLARAEALLLLARDAKDGLAVWHLLQDDDPAIAQRAHARLHAIAGTVPASASAGHLAPNAADRQAWKDVLEKAWW